MSDTRDMQAAHKANKERGNGLTVVEKYAQDVVTGKLQVSQTERTMSVKYLLELDLMRKKQRMTSASERKKTKKSKEKTEEDAPESQITPELAKRLASLEGK